jgi:hypothetical protein
MRTPFIKRVLEESNSCFEVHSVVDIDQLF